MSQDETPKPQAIVQVVLNSQENLESESEISNCRIPLELNEQNVKSLGGQNYFTSNIFHCKEKGTFQYGVGGRKQTFPPARPISFLVKAAL